MANFLEPTGTTPSLASDLSDRTTPSFGSDDTEADARKATQTLYLKKPMTVAISSPEKTTPTKAVEDLERVQTKIFDEFASHIDEIFAGPAADAAAAVAHAGESTSKVFSREIKGPYGKAPGPPSKPLDIPHPTDS